MIKDKYKTKKQLVNELKQPHQRINELERLKTKRKWAEKELEKAYNLYRMLIEHANDAIISTNRDGLIITFNKKAEELFGYSREEILGKSATLFVHQRYREAQKKVIEKFKRTNELDINRRTIKGKGLRKDGQEILVEASYYALEISGEHIITSIIRNITERKKAENEVREAKEFLENIFSTSIDGIIVSNPEGYITMVNKAATKMLGYTKDELIGKHPIVLQTTGEEEKEKGSALIEKLLSEGTLSGIERTWRRRDGSLIDISFNLVLIKDKEGNITGAVGSIRDVTERKRIETELKKSDEEIRNLNKQMEFILGATNTGIDIIDSDFNIRYIDAEWKKIYGDPTGRKCYEYFMDRSEVCPECGIPKALETKTSTITEEVLVKENNRPIQVTTIPFQNEKGEWLVAEVNVDITERKKIEEALKKSEVKYQSLIENANDAIISINQEGMIIGFNKKAEGMFGYSREEILGKSSYLLAPPQVRENQKKILKRWRETGCIDIDGKLIEGRGLKKDGKEFPAEFSYYILEHYGEVINTAIVRDISERKMAEQRLIEHQNQLRSLASQLTLAEEQERRRFATYLHDHIGQTLFGIHMKLDLLKHSLSTNDDIKHLEEVVNSIQQMIKDTRLLTFELSPPILYESNLESALDSLTERMHEQYGIMVTLKNDKQEKPLDDDIKVFLFQAVRELLINVVKHAQAKSVRISIQKENTRIRIYVEDDGVGFIPLSNDFSQDKPKGFGLFSIRERLNYLGGSLEIKSQPGHGTKITIFSPLRAKKRKSNEKKSKPDNVMR